MRPNMWASRDKISEFFFIPSICELPHCGAIKINNGNGILFPNDKVTKHHHYKGYCEKPLGFPLKGGDQGT